MRFTADHAFHIGSQHLRGGMPCQDYATSGGDSDSTFVVVSDGCSSGGKTDVGARIVALNTAGDLWGPDVTGARSFDVACFSRDTSIAADLGLQLNDLLATCLYAKAIPSLRGVQIRVVGDGVVAHRGTNGGLWMARIEWAQNMPAYRSYLADGFATFIAAHGDNPEAMTITEHYRDSIGAVISTWSATPQPANSAVRYGKEYYLNSEDTAQIEFAAIFSDGVTQVDGMDWRDVVAELMAFKSAEGDFVKRRMNRFLKDCLNHGRGPVDDISMACIHIDHGDAS